MSKLEMKIPPIIVLGVLGFIMWIISLVTTSQLIDLNPFKVFSLILFLIGISFSLAGVYAFRISGTTVNPRDPNRTFLLVTSGVYRYSRNPMYLGFFICLLAWGLFLGNPISLLVATFFVYYMNKYQIIPEEKVLAEKFGADFDSYSRRVSRWL